MMVLIVLAPSAAGDKDQIEKWTSNLHDLAALRVVKTNEEIKIELKKHLGLIETATQSTFDLSEFQKKNTSSPEQQIEAAKSKVVSQTPANVATSTPVTASEDIQLAEEDFMAELKDSLK